jgi:hypothetical protein
MLRKVRLKRLNTFTNFYCARAARLSSLPWIYLIMALFSNRTSCFIKEREGWGHPVSTALRFPLSQRNPKSKLTAEGAEKRKRAAEDFE